MSYTDRIKALTQRGTRARRGLGAAQAALTRARGVSEAGAVRENRGFRGAARDADGVERA